MKKWLPYLAIIFVGIAFSGLLYLKYGKERFMHLAVKYGPAAAIALLCLIILLVLLIYTLRYRKKKKKQREEASRIDLKDLFN